MKLQEHLQTIVPDPRYEKFVRACSARGQPPLDLRRLTMEALLGPHLRTPTEGDGTLLLRYKGHEAGVMSANELAGGAEWRVVQVQGSHSRKSFRVASNLEWQRCLAAQWHKYAHHGEAEVERLTMPPLELITNVTDAHDLDAARRSYALVQAELGMRFSGEEALWIVDLERQRIRTLLSTTGRVD